MGALKLRKPYLVHLVVNVTVTCGLKNLMPLLSDRIELIHVICAAIRVCPCK